MKKIDILIDTIVSIILTFVLAEIFSLYHFGDKPTLLTSMYLISLFTMIEYSLLSLIYIIRKIMSKEKITIKEIVARVLLYGGLIFFILGYIISINIDWLNQYSSSSPFYVHVLIDSLEFLLPAITLIIISVVLSKKKNLKDNKK